MEASDINQFMGEEARVVELGGLLERAGRQDWSQWLDLPASPGIYAVCLTGWRTCSFSSDAGMAKHANPASPKSLCDKRDRILTFGQTDILYIGKAGGKTGSLRKRVSQLVRFGVGKAKNHRGGEWLWQLQEIGNAQVWMWCCSRDEPERIERKLLERFKANHCDWPLANRRS